MLHFTFYFSILVSCTRTSDHRTRRDRTNNRTALFDSQMGPLCNGYKVWSAGLAETGMATAHVKSDGVVDQILLIRVVDIFSKSFFSFPS